MTGVTEGLPDQEALGGAYCETDFVIVTVCKNNRDGVARTWESIRNQTCKSYHWVIIDGGSTDGTLDFLKQLEDRIYWESALDSGIYSAMNRGLGWIMNAARDDMASTYVCFLNSGDTLADTDTLRHVKARAGKFKAASGVLPDLIYGDSYEKLGGGGMLVYKKARSASMLWNGMFTRHQAMFFRQAAVGSLRYNETRRIAGDYEFVALFMRHAKAVQYLGMPVCVFEQGGVSYQKWREGLAEWNEIQRDIFNLGLPLRMVLMFIRTAGAYLRMKMPRVYNTLRFRKL